MNKINIILTIFLRCSGIDTNDQVPQRMALFQEKAQQCNNVPIRCCSKVNAILDWKLAVIPKHTISLTLKIVPAAICHLMMSGSCLYVVYTRQQTLAHPDSHLNLIISTKVTD